MYANSNFALSDYDCSLLDSNNLDYEYTRWRSLYKSLVAIAYTTSLSAEIRELELVGQSVQFIAVKLNFREQFNFCESTYSLDVLSCTRAAREWPPCFSSQHFK